MELYEYIAIFKDEVPTKDDVIKLITETHWNLFECPRMILNSVAERILEEKYNDWAMWDEDSCVYLAVRKFATEEWELHKATIQYRLCVDTEEIFFDEE